jgi:toxin ParE1/3/4
MKGASLLQKRSRRLFENSSRMDELAWTDVALQDLDDIASYIVLDSPRSAEKVVRRIVETVAALAYHPKMGRAGRDGSTRELVVSGTPYIAVYRLRERNRNHHDLPLREKMAGKFRRLIKSIEARASADILSMDARRQSLSRYSCSSLPDRGCGFGAPCGRQPICS